MENIKDVLINRGYPEAAAIQTAQRLSALTGELKDVATSWIKSGAEIEVVSNGYTTKSLMRQFPGMTYPAALLTIDWLNRESEKAKQTIEKGIR